MLCGRRWTRAWPHWPRPTSSPAHGDAHAGNLLRTDAGWVWCDFEDAARMPRHWDLACAVFRGPLDGEEPEWAAAVQRCVLGAAPAPADWDAFELALAVRTVQSVSGGLLLAEHGHPAGATVGRRLEATRTFLANLLLPR
jgi:aminoglycoside phosphotransferase (APT) family kinase protein